MYQSVQNKSRMYQYASQVRTKPSRMMMVLDGPESEALTNPNLFSPPEVHLKLIPELCVMQRGAIQRALVN